MEAKNIRSFILDFALSTVFFFFFGGNLRMDRLGKRQAFICNRLY